MINLRNSLRMKGKGQSNEKYEKTDKERRNKLQLIVIPETNGQKQ